MGIIQIKNLSFTYPGAPTAVFDRLSVNLDDHWKLGMIGRNGRGKTTFLNLLRGQLPDHGAIRANVSFQYFPNPPQQAAVTVMQVMTATGAAEWQASVELARIGLPATIGDRVFATLSGGEQTKVLLARGFVNQTDFPLIDEPTNHLDILGRQRVGDYLRHKRGFICVSHDQDFLDRFVDHVMSLNRSSVDLVAGTVQDWQAEKRLRDQAAVTQNERLQRNIRQLKQRASTQRNWAEQREGETNDATSRAKAAKLMRRAKSFEARTRQRVEERQGLVADVDTVTRLSTGLTRQKNDGQLLLSLRQYVPQRAGRALFVPIDLDFHQGDRLAILGPNGVGKTSLVTSLLHPTTLTTTGYQVNHLPHDVAVVSQDFATVVRQMRPADWGDDQTRTKVWNIMHQLGVSRTRLRAPAAQWSMGEAKKAALAVTLCQPHALLVWDEPTNYLDIDAREQLIDVLKAARPTVIIIDHDRHFVDQVCTQQLVLRLP